MLASSSVVDSADVVKRVAAFGWAACHTADSSAVLRLAEALGNPIQYDGRSLIEELRIKSFKEAAPRSLSALYGTGGFPLHTDYAHWPTPPRFVLLRSNSVEQRVRQTIVISLASATLNSEEVKALKHHVWIVCGARRPFYTRLLRRFHNTDMFRFDSACMRPAYTSAAESARILLKVCARLRRISFDWSLGRTLVLDNWRTVHGRSCESHPQDDVRLLQRIIVNSRGKTH